MENLKIFVKNFSKTPGTRYRDEGKKAHSGQQFREEILAPAFQKVRNGEYGKLVVDLDGTIGYGTSWLEEVFGGLAREYETQEVLHRLELISNEEPYLIEDINQYIRNAKGKE